MKKKYYTLFIIYFITLLGIYCNSDTTKISEGEKLARIHCASCHAFTEPSLLNKNTWSEGVLPKMAEMMYVDAYYNPYSTNGPEGDMSQTRAAPQNLFPVEKWNKIYNYYISNAPEDPISRKEDLPVIQQGLKFFTSHSIYDKVSLPVTTLVKFDTTTKKIFFADGSAKKLFVLDQQFKVIDSMEIPLGVTDINIMQKGIKAISMGILKPSDEKLGKLSLISENKTSIDLLDTLQRPVHAIYADLNADNKEDIILCEFGFRKGGLSWLENKGNNQFEKHVLRALPGATRTEVYDFNSDGKPDIAALMAQGDEGIFIYYNEGKGKFREERVIQFPPSYGSNHFQLFDFNQDGYIDILTTNGDNGDYSVILKAYHGIRIFLNNQKNQYTERIFLPVYGVQKAIPADFDNDGDFDLVSIAFFPDYEKLPEESFIYWENTGNYQYKRYTFSGVTDGRWWTMDAGDIDGDGDKDIILGNAFFSFGNVPQSLKEKWGKRPLSAIILENTLYNKNH